MGKSVDSVEELLNITEELTGLGIKTNENAEKLTNGSIQDYKSSPDSNNYIRQWIIDSALNRSWQRSSVNQEIKQI